MKEGGLSKELFLASLTFPLLLIISIYLGTYTHALEVERFAMGEAEYTGDSYNEKNDGE